MGKAAGQHLCRRAISANCTWVASVQRGRSGRRAGRGGAVCAAVRGRRWERPPPLHAGLPFSERRVTALPVERLLISLEMMYMLPSFPWAFAPDTWMSSFGFMEIPLSDQNHPGAATA